MKGRPKTALFSLSNRELLVLLAAVGLVLGATGIVWAVDAIWGSPGLSVENAEEEGLVPTRLNVNTARLYELTMLPGVGEKTAAVILEDRQTNGPFSSLQELTRIRGIGPKTVQRIRPHAMCAPPQEGE